MANWRQWPALYTENAQTEVKRIPITVYAALDELRRNQVRVEDIVKALKLLDEKHKAAYQAMINQV